MYGYTAQTWNQGTCTHALSGLKVGELNHGELKEKKCFKNVFFFFFFAYCKEGTADTLKSSGNMGNENDDTGSLSHFNIRFRILEWDCLYIKLNRDGK